MIVLPGSVLGRLNENMTDIRLYAAGDSVEIPYRLHIAHDQLRSLQRNAEQFNVSYRQHELFFTIRNARKESVNGARLEFAEANFDARVTVEGSYDQKVWFELGARARLIALDDDKLQYRFTDVQWPTAEYSYLRFHIQGDRKLTLQQVLFSFTTRERGHYQEWVYPATARVQNQASEIHVRLPEVALLSKISVVPAPGQRFYRRLRIEYLADSVATEKGIRKYYRPLLNTILSSHRQDTLTFEAVRCQEVRITVEHDDNPPIGLAEIRLWSPEVRLVAFLKPGAHELRYGDARARAPRYDLALFEDEPGQIEQPLVPGPETAIGPGTAEETGVIIPKIWLWIVMGGVMVLLTVATLSLIRKTPS